MWHLTRIEYDSEEFTYHLDIDSDEELDDNYVESNTLIFPEVTTITELVDVFPKDVTHNGISQTHLTHLLLALHFYKYDTRTVELLWTMKTVPMQYSLRYSKIID